MSHYTTEVRFYCETLSGLNRSEGYAAKIEKILDIAVPQIFNFDFPLFDPQYKDVLCRKIIKHYYTREIGFETIALWKMKLNVKLNEIMPYYNLLYESALLKFDPFNDVNYTRHYNKDHDGTQYIDAQVDNNLHAKVTIDHDNNTHDVYGEIGKVITNFDGRSTTDSDSRGQLSETRSDNTHNVTKTEAEESQNKTDLYSDTPQNGLTNVAQGKYLTNARVINDTKNNVTNQTGDTDTTSQVDQTTSSTSNTTTVTTNDTVTNTTNNTTRDINDTLSQTTDNTQSSTQTTQHDTKIKNLEDYWENVTGKMNSGGSYSRLLTEFRETFINIDMLIINELDELFMQLW